MFGIRKNNISDFEAHDFPSNHQCQKQTKQIETEQNLN